MGATVLVIGGGGREHALAWKLRQSKLVSRVWAAPGNDGMIGIAKRAPKATDIDGWLELCRKEAVDLVIVGPEDPLVAGAADRLREEGLAVFGPGALAARLEGDKAWAKEFMADAGIPTAGAQVVENLEDAREAIARREGRCVVKASGLAAGKGVVVCDTAEQAEAAVKACLEDGAFGDAGKKVLIEDRLEGPELSVFAVLDGKDYAVFMPARDHKRLREGDEGPNTGGMGAYTPVEEANPELVSRIEGEVLKPALAELQERNLDFRGLLFVGIMLTADGPMVLEFNVRFGDPETQVILPTYPEDLYELLMGAAEGRLPKTGPLARAGSAVGVVLASAGYPASAEKGVALPGVETLGREELVFHAATSRTEDGWVTDGGRVLCAIGRAERLTPARAEANRLAEKLQFEGAQWRRDIAAQESMPTPEPVKKKNKRPKRTKSASQSEE